MTVAPTVKQRYALIVNTKSRQGAEWFDAAKIQIAEAGHELIAARAVTNPKKLPDICDELVSQRPDVLVVGGGDGTICEVVNHVISTDIVCALLPLGTTNNFARTADIPLDFDEAMEVALNGDTTLVDVAKTGERYFVNVASVGISTKIAARVSDVHKKLFGRLAYGIAGVRELIAHKPLHCTIEANGKTYDFHTHQLVIANGKYHSGVEISPGATSEDGVLTVFSMDAGSRGQLIRNFLSFSRKGIADMTGKEVIRSREIRLTTRPIRRMEIDGEVGPATPVTVTCQPKALRLKVRRGKR